MNAVRLLQAATMPFIKPVKNRSNTGRSQRYVHVCCARLLAMTLVVGMSLSVSVSAANERILEQAWFEDRSASLTIEQAKGSAEWVPYQGLLSQGYGTGAIWVRLVIAPDPSQVLILKMRPAYLDRIEIYGADQDEPLAVVGDLIHPQAAERISQSFNHTLAPSDQPVTVWLRISSTSTRQLLVDVLTEAEWIANKLRGQFVAVFYVVALFVLFLTAMIQWQVTNDRVFAVFALSVGTACAYGLSVTGQLRLVWPLAWSAEALDAYQSFFSIAATAAAIAFHFSFLKRIGLPKWAVVLSRVYLVYQLFKFGLLFSGQVITALTLNLLDVLIAPILMLLLSLIAGTGSEADRLLPRWMVIGLYILLLIFMLIAALPGLGWTPGPEFSLYVVQVNALVTTILILAILQYRQRLLNRQRVELEAEATEARQAAG